MDVTQDRSAVGLAALLAVAGTTHFVNPSFYDPLVPRVLPGRARTWVYLSGAAELAVAATVLMPRTRAVGGKLAAVLFVTVFPGNVQMAWDWRDRDASQRAAAYGRLPLQAPLVWWARRVSRRATGGGRAATPGP